MSVGGGRREYVPVGLATASLLSTPPSAATRPCRPENSLVFGLFLTLGQRQPDLLFQLGLEARLQAELARQFFQVGPLQKMLLIDH